MHLSRGDAFSALDAGMAAVKLAARAVEEEEEEERREEAEAREEKERAVTVAVENGERGGRGVHAAAAVRRHFLIVDSSRVDKYIVDFLIVDF